MRQIASILAAALAGICATAAHAQTPIRFGGFPVPWGLRVDEGSARISWTANYTLQRVDTAGRTLRVSFMKDGGAARGVFTANGLAEVEVDLEDLGAPDEVFSIRRERWSEHFGAGAPGPQPNSWRWTGSDGAWLILAVRGGRVFEHFAGPTAVRDASRPATASPTLESLAREGRRWLATRADTLRWRPLGVTDTTAVVWDSAGTVVVMDGDQKKVTATIRWEFRDPRRWEDLGPFTAFELRAQYNCGWTRWSVPFPDVKRFTWYSGGAEANPPPRRPPWWAVVAAGGANVGWTLCQRAGRR
ncbi:MAG TPA: hypothetical protein VFS20_12100 [Longimicrobium sp.]|nr:hypothetical protein [Longimicrobium sp.]